MGEGRKRERGEVMNKQKKVITVLCIMLAASSPFGIYRLIQWDIETRQKEEEAKVREAQEAKEADEEAYKQAKEYMRDYRIELQEQMQAAGIDDIKVGYEKHEHNAWNYEFEGQEAGYQYFYYELKYYSESIDTLFEACAETGEYDSFVELMQKEYKAKEHRPQVSGFHKIHIGDRNYGVRVEDKGDEGELTIYRDIHLYYTLEQEEDGVDLYENTDLVYSTRPEVEVPEKEESDASGSGSTKHNGGSSSGGSGYGSFHGSTGGSGSGSFSGSFGGSYSGSYSGKKTDPYDVYDYDDPDDFAEEWAEDFGDGDYDDGYDDAYDYWEDEYDD